MLTQKVSQWVPMRWLQKIPGSVRAPSGWEWALWRKLPLIAIVGTLLPLLILGVLHYWSDASPQADHERWLQRMDFMVGALIIFHWTMVITVGIGCCVVMVMKGPGYQADSYPISHSDRPRATVQTSEEARQQRKVLRQQANADQDASEPG